MTESMVERVARAIARHRNRVDRGWDVDDGWDIAEGRAAIAAMGESIVKEIRKVTDRIESPYAGLIFVAADYSKADLIRDLRKISDSFIDQDTAGGGGTTTATG